MAKKAKKTTTTKKPTPTAPAVTRTKVLPVGQPPPGHPNLTRAGLGRPKNAPNKVTKAMKEAFRDAFDDLGGVQSLVQWAKTDKRTFYTLAARLIPHELVGPGDDGAHVVTVEHVHIKE